MQVKKPGIRCTIIKPAACLLAAIFLFPLRATAADSTRKCPGEAQYEKMLADAQENEKTAPNETAKRVASLAVDRARRRLEEVTADCVNRDSKLEREKVGEDICDEKQREYAKANKGAVIWKWNSVKNQCENLSDTKPLTDSDECNSASVFSGSLKGQKCKEAASTINDVRSRNNALSETSQVLAGGYGTMQAMQATGQQADAQTRQGNIMKMLAVSKLLTGGAQLEGAMELKNAASGAESAKNSISNAQKLLAEKCQGQADDQTCFFQNAASVGIEPSQASYASFERMKTAARQSQDQADAASQLAKSSMITGLADTLVGIQAMRMAQQANQNAAGLGMMPGIAPPPRPPGYAFTGPGQSAVGGLGQSQPAAPTDYGVAGNGGPNMGDQKWDPIRGTLMPGHSYGSTSYKQAPSGVSGGAGGAGGGGFAGLKGGSGGAQNRARKGPFASGDYAVGAAPQSFKGGNNEKEAVAPGSNPLADMLAKMFPQDKDGKPVVDSRTIASEAAGQRTEQGQQEDVLSSDVTIFEQISARYRQLNGSGQI